jgi:hypothetical protein
MTRIVFILLLSLIAPFSYSAEEIIGEPLEKAGTRLDLPSGDQLQLAIDEKLVVGHFVDKEGNLIKSPASSIVVVVDQTGHRNDDWRTVIKPVDEAKLSSSRKLFPPYNFRARLIIRFTDGSTKTIPNASVKLDKEAE